MHGVASGRLGGRNHGLDVEIGPRAAPGDFVGRVGGADMQRLRVVVGIDRDGGEAGSPAARAMRMAISPRLAISSLWKDIGVPVSF